MTILDFFVEIQAEMRAQMRKESPFAELAFSEVVMRHLAEVGMTADPVVCHFQGEANNVNLHLSGYSLSERENQLDLFVSLYQGGDDLFQISNQDAETAATQCVSFLQLCTEGRMAENCDPTSDVYSLALTIRKIYGDLEQVRVYVLTDGLVTTKYFNRCEIGGKDVTLEVMDIERLYSHSRIGRAPRTRIEDRIS